MKYTEFLIGFGRDGNRWAAERREENNARKQISKRNESSKSRYSIKRIYYYDVNIKLGFQIISSKI